MTSTARTLVFADLLRPEEARARLLFDVAAALGGALLLALLARLEARLPFSPVPITGQTLGVLLAGSLLGSRRALAAVALYLGAGLSGLPLFSGAGAGPLWLLGPTGGYLVGFLPGAWLTGRLAEAGLDRSVPRALLAMAAGLAAVFALGLTWLALWPLPGDPLALGLYPFLPGEALKVCLAGLLLPGAWRLAGRR